MLHVKMSDMHIQSKVLRPESVCAEALCRFSKSALRHPLKCSDTSTRQTGERINGVNLRSGARVDFPAVPFVWRIMWTAAAEHKMLSGGLQLIHTLNTLAYRSCSVFLLFKYFMHIYSGFPGCIPIKTPKK